MAYVSVAEWRPEQVTEWLKGLDNSIVSYIHWFSNNEVNGQQLLDLTPDELTHLGVYKLGHQELILEAVQQLRNFHYDLDRENLQFLALKLSCAANSLYSEIRDQAESSSVPTQIMADVANVIHNVKPLVHWLDRPPFSGQIQYTDYKSQLLSLSLEMATSALRDRFAERPVAEIRTCSSKLAKLAESIIQDVTDPMILQPATLDLATIKKKAGEDLDFFLVPSFHGIHQIGDMKLSSSAHQSGKIQQGDEIVQVNYQTVVGWSRKKVLALFEESPNDLLLTLKRRPRHVKMYGQIYMKPYRLPSRKRASPYSRWNDNLPSPRPELLTIPDFDTTRNLTKKIENDQNLLLEPSGTSSSSDEEFGQPSDSQSPSSMRLYLSKPRTSIQRRFTLSGPPRPSAHSEQFWRELQMERSWRNNQSNSQINKSSDQNAGSKERNVDEMFHLRDKSASLGNSIATASSRSTTCVPFMKDQMGSVKFDLPKFEAFKCDKIVGGEKDKGAQDGDAKDGSDASKSELPVESNGSEENVCATLSITELNKLKRNAFFNNMDCSNGENRRGETGGETVQAESFGSLRKEGSSDKVKRVIENFKSEINKTKKDVVDLEILKSPGKVMELVENFEKKESLNSLNNNNNKGNSPEKFSYSARGHAEKSNRENGSNLSICDAVDSNKFMESKAKFEEKMAREKAHDTTGKISINHCDKIEKNFSRENQTSKTSKSNTHDANFSKRVVNGKVLPTPDVPPALDVQNTRSLEKIKKDKSLYDKSSYGPPEHGSVPQPSIRKNDSSETAAEPATKTGDGFKCEFPAPNASDTVIVKADEPKKPVPAQRKSKMSPENNLVSNTPVNPFPLPPKPRTKLTYPVPVDWVLHAEETDPPPRLPPRLENTFPLKPAVAAKKGAEAVGENMKPEVKCVSEAVNRPLANSSAGKAPFASTPVLSVTPEPQKIVTVEPKSLATTPVSAVRKLIKPKQGGSSLFSSSSPDKEKEKSEKPKSSGGTFESLKAILVLSRKQNVNSPRSVRKKNALLAKKRNVSVKELTPCDNAGYLYYRNRKGMAVDWTKHYFVLQGSNFYGFKAKESSKADLLIHLPGFTCSVAEEVKSKDFPFKIYHTGTAFYFAADTKENLQQWLDSVNLAIFYQEEKGTSESFAYSQTDSDSSDSEPEPETCFPTSPKMKKVLGTSSLPKPARSHQNLASDFKKGNDIQRRFGSLKKLSSRKNSTIGNQFSNSGENTAEVASLDRKYLRFLGQKHSPTPVPTSDFRSYRRINPTPASTGKSGKTKGKSKISENVAESPGAVDPSMARDPPVLIKRPMHSSNPSLINPEMADYRITQERLSEFRRLRNQGNDSQHRFMTSDQFMREESFRSNGDRSQEFSGFITLEQFLLRQEEERHRCRKPEERPGPSNEFDFRMAYRQSEEDRSNSEVSNRGGKDHAVAGTSGLAHRSKRPECETPQVVPRNKDQIVSNPGVKLKNVNVNQRPPPAIRVFSSNAQDDGTMGAFDVNSERSKSTKGPEMGSGGDSNSSRIPEMVHSVRHPAKSSYQGIEYPPAFEPETYTLQHMLQDRQKRGQDSKK